jgi:hypothetical protein
LNTGSRRAPGQSRNTRTISAQRVPQQQPVGTTEVTPGEGLQQKNPARSPTARPRRPGRRPGRLTAWILRVRVWIAIIIAGIQSLWQSRQSKKQQEPVRAAIIRQLQRAEDRLPHVTPADIAEAGSRDVAEATIAARATRAPSTMAAATRAAREVRRFVEANPRLLANRSEAGPSATDWDAALEAFVFAEAAAGAGASCPWKRARRQHEPSVARSAGSLRALLESLNYVQNATWGRSKAMSRTWGVNDPEDVAHATPIFTWELVEGLRLAPAPATPWELAAAALLVCGALNATRKGSCLRLLVGEVTVTGPDSVEVAAHARPKHHRERATKRPRKHATPVVLRHWLVRTHLIPWLAWHRRQRSPPSALLFPAIATTKPRNAPTTCFKADNQWIQPTTEWSDRAVRDALSKYIYRLQERTFQGLRAGNNRELRRAPQVSAITRRSLHGRTLRPLIGSEAAYDHPFAEDFAEATEELGKLRIERTPQGLLTVTASSKSAGEDPKDWVILPKAIQLAPGGPASDDEDSDDEEEHAAYKCGRCKVWVRGKDYGWLCDEEGCSWGTCTTCHRGGARAPLRCPAHSHTSDPHSTSTNRR